MIHIYGKNGWRDFIDNNLLHSYVDDNYLPNLTSRGYYFWNKNIHNEDYNAEALRYVEFASDVISSRADGIIERLRKLLQI